MSTPKGRFVGQFIVNPRDTYTKNLAQFCEPGSPSRCLLGTFASAYVGQRVTFTLTKHATRRGEKAEGFVSLTDGDYRWTRPMYPFEAKFASNFDLGKRNRQPITVTLDTRTPDWTPKPKSIGGGAKTTQNHNGQGGAKGPRQTALASARRMIAERKLASVV